MPPLLNLDPDQLLSTTRAVRKRPDLTRDVQQELITERLKIAARSEERRVGKAGARKCGSSDWRSDGCSSDLRSCSGTASARRSWPRTPRSPSTPPERPPLIGAGGEGR